MPCYRDGCHDNRSRRVRTEAGNGQCRDPETTSALSPLFDSTIKGVTLPHCRVDALTQLDDDREQADSQPQVRLDMQRRPALRPRGSGVA